LSNATGGATIGIGSASITVTDDDATRQVLIADTSAVEGDQTTHYRGDFIQGIPGVGFNEVEFGPDGNLYAGYGGGSAMFIDRYDGTTGAFLNRVDHRRRQHQSDRNHLGPQQCRASLDRRQRHGQSLPVRQRRDARVQAASATFDWQPATPIRRALPIHHPQAIRVSLVCEPRLSIAFSRTISTPRWISSRFWNPCNLKQWDANEASLPETVDDSSAMCFVFSPGRDGGWRVACFRGSLAK
jgi:hypothetical protein